MPDGVDPCEFALEQGREAFESLVESAVDALDYRLEEAAAKVAGKGDDAALAAVESVLVALSRVSDRSTLAPSQRRLREDQVLGRLARRFAGACVPHGGAARRARHRGAGQRRVAE
jgi:DNA primase